MNFKDKSTERYGSKNTNILCCFFRWKTTLYIYNILFLFTCIIVLCSCVSIISSAKHGDIDGIEQSLKSGESIETRTQNGSTPLIVATYNRKARTVEYLLKNGADINATDNNNCSPLIHAAYYNLTDVAKILIKYNADQTIKDRYGNTAYYYALENGHSTILSLLDKEAQEKFPVDSSSPAPMIASEKYRQFKLCIFPWKIAAGVTSTSASNTKNAVNSVMEILKDEKQIVLTHCYYKSEIPMAYQEISMNTAFLRGISQNEAWAKTNPFSKPEPNSKLIIQKGKEIDADIGLLVRIENIGTGNRGVSVYLVDIQKNVITRSEDSVYYINTGEAVKDGVREQLDRFLSAKK